jgi:hypothetical protein
VDHLRHTENRASQLLIRDMGRIGEMDEEVRKHKKTIKGLEEKIENQNKKWDEREKEIRGYRDHPELPFSFAGLISQRATKQDSEGTQSNPGTTDDPAPGLAAKPTDQKRRPSSTPVGDLLPLSYRLENNIAKLKVTNLFSLSKDAFLEKNPNKTLTIAAEAIKLCYENNLAKDRILLARAIFWKAQAELQLKMWAEAHTDFEDAVALGLGPTSNCPEGDAVVTLRKRAREECEKGKEAAAAAATAGMVGGTPGDGLFHNVNLS